MIITNTWFRCQKKVCWVPQNSDASVICSQTDLHSKVNSRFKNS